FFQAEDGIRDFHVTGVQTCALPIYERHRHRYELNNHYREQLAGHGFLVSGTSPDGNLVEVVELRNHPWFVAVQCHPEFKSKPTRSEERRVGKECRARL